MAPHSGRPPGSKGTGPRSNGVISIPAAATKKPSPLKPENMPTRIAAPRLKLVVRKLPPGLTQPEYEDMMGEDWKVDGGKVDWLVYQAGKVSKEYDLSMLYPLYGTLIALKSSEAIKAITCLSTFDESRIHRPARSESSFDHLQ